MKLFVFTDMHGSFATLKKIETKAKQASLIVCLGDFTIFGQKQEKILKAFHDFDKLFLLIHGNHENGAVVDQQCKKYKNILFVHKKILRIGNLIFIGYGGDGFSFRDKQFETIFVPRFTDGLKKYKAKIEEEGKKPTTFLLLHGPPYGSKVDAIRDQHCGNKSFRDFYVKNKIDYVFSGHIHESAGAVEHIKGTTLMNPGPLGMLVEV